MKTFSCKVTEFHFGTSLNKISIIDVFLGIIQPFETQLFVRAVAKYKSLFYRRFSTRLRPKMKMWNWRKVFYMVYRKLDFSNFKQRSSKVVKYKWLLHSLFRICFYLEKRSLFQSFILEKQILIEGKL